MLLFTNFSSDQIQNNSAAPTLLGICAGGISGLQAQAGGKSDSNNFLHFLALSGSSS